MVLCPCTSDLSHVIVSAQESVRMKSDSLLGLPHALVVSLSVCLFYASSSIAISMLNKAILSSYNFSCFFFMLAAQLAMTLTFCVVSRDYAGNPFRLPIFDMAIYRASIPMAAAYIANVCLGLLGMQMVNIPMFFCIRRTAAAFILLYEYVSMGRVAEFNVRSAVGIICLGAIVAGWESLSADVIGYGVTFANNLATAAASVMQKQFADSTKLGGTGGPFGIMYYQALTALPVCVVLSLATGEMPTLMAFEHLWDAAFWMAFILASVMGLLLSYSSLLCTTHNSPLATSITGNLKDVVITVAGAIMFSGFKATTTSVSGLMISFSGSGLYSYINLKKALAKQPAPSGPPSTAISVVAPSIKAEDAAEAGDSAEASIARTPIPPSTPLVVSGGSQHDEDSIAGRSGRLQRR